MVGKVLQRTIVKTFYQANAGFFLVSLALVFGFLKTPQHVDIATALAFNPVYYLIPLVIWALYALKTLQFCATSRRLFENQFLSYLILLKASKRKPLVIYIQALLLIPILAYSLLLLVIALQHSQWISAGIVVAGNALILLATAHFLHQILIRPVDAKAISGFRLWTSRLPKKLAFLFTHHLLNRQVVLLLGTKLISLTVLTGFIMIYDIEGTDLRFLSLGLLLSTGVNSILAFHLHKFSQEHLGIFRNLPISTRTWFWQYFLSLLLLFVPELIAFYGQNLGTVSLYFLVENSLFSAALLSFYHALTYFRPVTNENYVKYPFLGTAILFFIILGYVSIHYIALALLVVGYLIFVRYHSRYTPIVSD